MEQRELLVRPVPPAQRDAATALLLAEVLDNGYPRLVGRLLAVTGDLAEAETVAQEAFVRARDRVTGFGEAGDPEAWLHSVAVRLHRRRRLSPWVRGVPALRRRTPAVAVVEPLVATPTYSSIERRALLRRRRHNAATAVLTATAVLLTISVADLLAGRQDESDVPVPVQLDRWPGSPHWPALSRGDYHFPLSPFRDVPTVRLTLGTGWRADVELRHSAGDGTVRLLVADVDQVVRTGCEATDRGMVDVPDRPTEIAAALGRAPGLTQVEPTREVTAFGRPALFLRFTTTDAVVCRFRQTFNLLDTANGLVPAARPGSALDAWVVDVAGRAVLVATVTTPDADAEGRARLLDVLETVQLVPARR